MSKGWGVSTVLDRVSCGCDIEMELWVRIFISRLGQSLILSMAGKRRSERYPIQSETSQSTGKQADWYGCYSTCQWMDGFDLTFTRVGEI